MNIAAAVPIRSVRQYRIGIPLLLVALLAMILLPLPAFILDILFTFNIAFAMIVLLAGIYASRPLDFAAFPTILLVATLFRLALNIGSTRVVLLHGADGTHAAGKVIQAFGEVVIGGNYAVGFIVFLILVIINFVVVTKGAGRISEVTARFTLDAMPGKQMAIDADLNAGLIDAEVAKKRRAQIEQEADFYGSMDGASKFVRGDAIAGLLILVINIFGGVGIGILQHHLSFMQAISVFGILTIGDGLVAQIPAIFLSTASAIMVTRVSEEQDMGDQVVTQLFSDPKSLFITGSIVFSLGMIPGMPHLAFLGLGACSIGFALWIKRRHWRLHHEKEKIESQPQKHDSVKELTWDDLHPLDDVGLEVGYRLIPLVDQKKKGPLIGKLQGIRKKISQEMGFLYPPVHVRDNLKLDPDSYSIHFRGVEVGRGKLFEGMYLAIASGEIIGEMKGLKVKDPTFGIDALWIDSDSKEKAEQSGYTVVDPATVLATHLSHLFKNHAHQLFNYEILQQLLDALSAKSPKLVEEAKNLSQGVMVKIFQGLLKEGVPLTDLHGILIAIAEFSPKTQDPDALMIPIRMQLANLIVQKLVGNNPELEVATLEPKLEQLLLQTLQRQGPQAFVMEPQLADQVRQALLAFITSQKSIGKLAVLLVSSPLRGVLAKFMQTTLTELHILSYQEIPDSKQIKVIESIGQSE